MELGSEHYTGKGYLQKDIFRRYYPMYQKVLSFLPRPDVCPPILDLGCGVGYFAKVLADRGYKDYVGVDFSKAMLEYCVKMKTPYRFVLGDLNTEQTRKLFAHFSLFVTLQTLEHIKGDLEIIERIPRKSQIICSLPSYKSKGHVRIFKTKASIIHRYSRFIKIQNIVALKLRRKIIFVFNGYRRNKK